MHKLLNEADIVIAQNGDRFDIPKVNTRFVQYRVPPPKPFRTIDTLKVARQFGFNANNLDDLARDLGVGRKLAHTGKDLWLGCMQGKKKDWQVMKEYNKHDVHLLREVYKVLRPWIKNHPNLGVWQEKTVCPKCGSKKLNSRGWQFTQTSKFRRFQCMNCGGWGRIRHNELEYDVATN